MALCIAYAKSAGKARGGARGRRSAAAAGKSAVICEATKALYSKRRVVEKTLEGRESVSVVARRHDLNTNLLFTWRRRYQQGLLGDTSEATALVPIHVSPASSEATPSETPKEGQLELVLGCGHRVRVRGEVDPAVLRAALEVLCR